MYSKLIFIISIIFLLTACSSDIQTEPIKQQNQISTSIIQPFELYSLYYSFSDYTFKKYEPTKGCYLGAYILADKSIGYDMTLFESKTNPHSSYIYHLTVGDEFPLSWVLSCYKDLKLPFIILSPSADKPFNYTAITSYAKDFGRLDIPIMLGFYPSPVINNYQPEIYKSFYEFARNEFALYSPNTAFAFIMNSDEVYSIDDYVPSGSSIDWVGLDVCSSLENNQLDMSNLTSLSYFYNKYQSKYPLILSLAISHYSTSNHTYNISATTSAIKSIYLTLPKKYPRIKAVYYLDYDKSSLDLPTTIINISDNFLITDIDEIRLTYKQATELSYYHPKPIFKENKNIIETLPNSKTELKKAKFMVYRYQTDYYILSSDLDLLALTYTDVPISTINSLSLISLSKLAELNELTLSINKSTKQAFLLKP